MPKLESKQIKELISNNEVYGITLDTSVFDRFGCNLDFKVLNALEQFEHGQIKVLISEIVANEVKSHIARDAEETQRELNKALATQAKRWKLKTDINSLVANLSLKDSAQEAAEKQLSEYLVSVKAELVPAAGTEDSTKKLLDRYFSTQPPFESKAAKKNEFPDAFALLSLERIGQMHGKYVLCVCADKGWESYCDESESLIYVDDLNVALSYFNDSGRVTADKTMAMWRAGNSPELNTTVESALEYELESMNFYPEGSSPLSFEGYPEGAVMQYLDLQSAGDPIVISADEAEVTFSLSLTACVRFEAEFHFYVRDSIDKDYVNLGSHTYDTEENIPVSLVITVQRDIDTEPQVVDVEAAVHEPEIDFGYVEPFPGEDPTHEKY